MSNVKVIYPDVPVRAAAHTSSATFSDTAPLTNLDDGRRDNNAAVTSSPTEVIINHDLGSGNTASVDHLVVARADNVTVSGSVMVRGSSVSRFAPSSIAGLTAWFDANRGTTVDADNLVGQWNDLSGNGYNATQATTANKPILSRTDNKENYFRYSEEFNQGSVWTLNNATITANAATAPDGTTTADKLIDNATNAQHWVQQMVNVLAPNVSYRASVYVKAAELTSCRVIFYDAGSNFYGISLNLSTGVATVTSGGTVNGTSYTVTNVGSGWYLVSIVGTIPTPNANQHGLTINTASGGVSYAGSGNGILVWGASLQEAGADGTYLKTGDVRKPRGINGNRTIFFDGADYLRADTLAAPFSGTDKPMTAFAVYQITAGTGGAAWAFGRENAATIGANFMVRNKLLQAYRRDDAYSAKSFNTANLPDGSFSIVSFVFSGTAGTIYLNGSVVGTPNTDLDVGALSLDTFGIGHQRFGAANANILTGNISELIFYNSALSTTDRQTVEAYLTSKWITAPVVNIPNFNSETLYGTRAKDFITTFSPSTAYRHWWIEFYGTTVFQPSKIYLGRAFDPAVDCDYQWSIELPGSSEFISDSGERTASRVAAPRYTFELSWAGLTDAEISTFSESIWKRKEKSTFFLYASAQAQVLNEKTLFHVRLLSADWERVGKANYNVLRATFEEVQ